MYGDFTRNTSKPDKHYIDVRMQQGRVLLDSDWNEQVDIDAHRKETESVDVIGQHGGPAADAGFRIVTDKGDLTEKEAEGIEDLGAGDFYITPGRYYVDGILCRNEQTVRYAGQADLPGADIIEGGGAADRWLVYLDVWKRHISHIEDPGIREVALGGPDTTTRSKAVWQVKAAKVPLVAIHRLAGAIPFSSGCEELLHILPADSGARITTGRAPVLTEDKPCQISPKGGYQGLENRLYRVEIHQGGEPLAWPRPAGIQPADAQRVEGEDKKLKISLGNLQGIPWAEGQMVEVFSDATDEDGVPGVPAIIDKIEINEPDVILSFYKDISSMVEGDSLKVRRTAAFKWSRDNGSVASAIAEFVKENEADTSTNKIRISPPGRDRVLTFRPGDTVEILNDEDDLHQRPGILALVDPASTSDRDGSVVLRSRVPVVDKSLHPKLRRWDPSQETKAAEKMAVYPVTLDPADLEEGIRIQFSGQDFRSRDYWSFYARTVSGEVEELIDAPPQGVKHHYAPLAVIKSELQDDGQLLSIVSDCRRIFPPLTELTNIQYVGGNGQSSYPKKELDSPLRVRVSAGGMPVDGAPVLFRVLSGDGSLVQASPFTDDDGIAEALWTLGGNKSGKQQAEAVLQDGMGHETDKRIFFNANLSLAQDTFFDPRDCLQGFGEANTVQKALEQLCRMQSRQEPGIVVSKITVGDRPLDNDDNVRFDELANGILVTCKSPPGRDDILATVSDASCFVTVNMPFPLNPADIEIWGRSLRGYQQITLQSRIIAVDGNIIFWGPPGDITEFFKILFDRMRVLEFGRTVLARFILKGNFIWSGNEPRLYLDGDTFGTPGRNGNNSLILPSGDGRQGGDFEIWFRVTRE